MTKKAERGEMPDLKTYYGIKQEKVGRDFKPTEKDLKMEETVENMENRGIPLGQIRKEAGDIAPKRVVDFLKELALHTKREMSQETYFISQPAFDTKYGRMVVGQMFYKEGAVSVEFIIRDDETNEILESKNIKFMNELSPKYAEFLEKILREGYPDEKSH